MAMSDANYTYIRYIQGKFTFMYTPAGSKLCANAYRSTHSLQMINVPTKILIKGLTKEGKKFRPSDWAERLTGAVATFGRGRRIIFHPNVRMTTLDGVSCVEVDAELEQSDPMLFNFLMKFGESNHLQILRTDEIENTGQPSTVP